MRSEEEVFYMILEFANATKAVRLVTLEGSRVNSHIKKDRFQDYDISFFATPSDIEMLKTDEGWLKHFGECVMMQKPESMELFPPDLREGWLSYLMLFSDGVRIDLTLIPLDDVGFYFTHDKLVCVLLDKDNLAPNGLVASDSDFWIPPLTQRSFEDCCNEFYWLYHNAFKEIIRDEILSANFYLNAMRETLLILLSWRVGLKTMKNKKCLKHRNIAHQTLDSIKTLQDTLDSKNPHSHNPKNSLAYHFHFSLGKHSKFLPQHLSKKSRKNLYKSFHLGAKKEAKKSLKCLDRIFHKNAKKLCKYDFTYPHYRRNVKRWCEILEQ
ncbi:aminoglycoside adenylyltransferase [Helicobacter didelphidarum]|uniref:Aminoglycoside adenylyltransferase n=1 Tax=Helicobacter didelphidarum TaxID=2040648 RepID=A0A3D8IP03_9HELI|nr:aminoglycoside 6-adenylyltransferase [Helicobacter didelphidarum]RDU66988.1 aminoglycoside adenylyltransferase [Helicobacter didelphidarum]